MAQATRTSCAHNAPGQTLLAGIPVPCRKCGAMIQPSPRTVNAGNQLVKGENARNAAYPGDGSATDQAWVFGL